MFCCEQDSKNRPIIQIQYEVDISINYVLLDTVEEMGGNTAMH
eukprot:SAG31_NODE_170_length_21415_cov_8.230813_3_plen_43_part_00